MREVRSPPVSLARSSADICTPQHWRDARRGLARAGRTQRWPTRDDARELEQTSSELAKRLGADPDAVVSLPSAAAWTARSGGVTSLDECGGGVNVGTATLQGWRDAQEDAHVVVSDGALLLGLFDGHGGRDVVDFAARLHLPLLQRLAARASPRSCLAACAARTLLVPLIYACVRPLLIRLF